MQIEDPDCPQVQSLLLLLQGFDCLAMGEENDTNIFQL